MSEVRKTITPSRAKAQSDLLAGAVGTLLVMKVAAIGLALRRYGGWHDGVPSWFWVACGVSAGFALLVWMLRSATPQAAAMGGVICLNILMAQEHGLRWQHTAMPALLTLFVLTFGATRFGRARKERLGVAEARQGRCASQVIANLGVAGLCAGGTSPLLFAACLAAFAEATADTVSSEMGQALGGRTLLLTSWREVPAGTDGGISIAGTTLGASAAGAIVLVTATAGSISWEQGTAAFAAGIAGLLFDSLLGATVERRGWLGNDLVNFSSTVFAAFVASAVMRLASVMRQ